MPRGKKTKLLYIIRLFSERSDENNMLTIDDIIEYLDENGIGAERKSLYDDLKELNDFGIKIKKKKVGKECYYYLAERFLETAEIKLLVDSIQSSKFISENKSRTLIQKLESFAGVSERKKLSRQVYVQGRVKTMNESVYQSIDTIHSAIADGNQLSFQYLQWNMNKELEPKYDGKTYVVSPWALSCDEQNYYLIAYDPGHGEIRHYRVDKMKNVKETSDKREGKTQYKETNVAEYVKGNIGMMGGEDTPVTVSIPSYMIGVFIDRFGKEIRVFKTGEDTCEVTFHVRLSSMFYGWVAGLGKETVIISPAAAVEGAKRFAKENFDKYK